MSNMFLHFGLNIDIVQIRFPPRARKFWKFTAIVTLFWLNQRSAGTEEVQLRLMILFLPFASQPF